MSNKKQRNQNRGVAYALRSHVLNQQVCSECGERGRHWFQTSFTTLESMLAGLPPEGFWTCPNLYGEDGRRIVSVA